MQVATTTTLPGAPEVFWYQMRESYSCAVPLPARWIDAVEYGPALGVVERRLWVLLVARSWPLEPVAPEHSLALSSLRAALGIHRDRDYKRVELAIARLAELRLQPIEGGPRIRLFERIELAGAGAARRIVWQFSTAAVIWGLGSSGWMRADQPVLCRLHGRHSARLYVLLGLRARLRGRFWRVDAGDLQRLMVPGGQALESYGRFRRNVLLPGMKGLERATGWGITLSEGRGANGGRQVTLRLTDPMLSTGGRTGPGD